MGSLFLVSVSSFVRIYSGHILLAINDRKYETQKPHSRIIATNGKNPTPHISRFDITHDKYLNYCKLTMNVNRITSEAMSSSPDRERKSCVLVFLSIKQIKDKTIYVARESITLMKHSIICADTSVTDYNHGSARTTNHITPQASRESFPGDTTAEETTEVTPDRTQNESEETVGGGGGGRDGRRPLPPFQSLSEERQKEIKREKNRRNRHAKAVKSRAARESRRDEARMGLHNLSLLSGEGQRGSGSVAQQHGEPEALNSPSSSHNQQVAAAPHNQSTPQLREASANLQQRPTTTATNSRSSHQAAIRGRAPLQIRPPTSGDGHTSTYEVNMLLINSGKFLGRYVFETRPGGIVTVFLEIAHLEEAKAILEGAGYELGASAASPRQMSLVVPRQMVPPDSMPAPDRERRLREVPEVINNYNLDLGMPASSLTYRGHKVEQFADGAGVLKTRVRVWVNVTETGVNFLDTVDNTLCAGSAIVVLRLAGGQHRSTPVPAPAAPRSPHRSDNS